MEPVRLARPLRAGRSGWGSRGIGIWHADLEHLLETRTLREMKQIFDDHGLKYLELEFLNDWFFAAGDERAPAPTTPRSCSSTPPPRSAPTTSRSATSPGTPAELAQAHRGASRELCAGRRASTTAR